MPTITGLSEIHEKALALVADGLESGALAENFHMSEDRKDADVGDAPVTCGTVCCIVGWANEALIKAGQQQLRGNIFDLYEEDLHGLYFGHWSRNGVDEDDPALAARAIRHFLRTGKCPTPEEIGG